MVKKLKLVNFFGPSAGSSQPRRDDIDQLPAATHDPLPAKKSGGKLFSLRMEKNA